MASGRDRSRRCALCRVYKHPDDTVLLPSIAGEYAGVTRPRATARLCWDCVEAIRLEIPEQRPFDLKLLRGRGQGELFRAVIKSKLQAVEVNADGQGPAEVHREMSAVRAREARRRDQGR